MQQGQVLCAKGQPLPPSTPTPAGQWVWYYRMPSHEPSIPFDETVPFQDDWLVVADKPHFLPITPAGRYAQGTLLARLQRRLQLPHLAPLHRLDRETAGLAIFAVQPHTRNACAQLFRTQRVRKSYEAIATCNPALNGQLEPHATLLRASHLAPHAHVFFRMAEYPDRAPNSNTLIETIETIETLPDGQHVRLQPQPHTGLKHQLRVHLNALGMPIVGDRFYPHVRHGPTVDDNYQHPLQLLAQSLRFTDPFTQQAREFHSRFKLGGQPVAKG